MMMRWLRNVCISGNTLSTHVLQSVKDGSLLFIRRRGVPLKSYLRVEKPIFNQEGMQGSNPRRTIILA